MEDFKNFSLDDFERELQKRKAGKKYAFEIVISEAEYQLLLASYHERSLFYNKVEDYPFCYLKLVTETYANEFTNHEDSRKLQQLFTKIDLGKLNKYITLIPEFIREVRLAIIKRPDGLLTWKGNMAHVLLHAGIPICYIDDLYNLLHECFKKSYQNLDITTSFLLHNDFNGFHFTKYFSEIFSDQKYKKEIFKWLLEPIAKIYTDGSQCIGLFDGKIPRQIVSYFKNSRNYKSISPKLEYRARIPKSGIFLNLSKYCIEESKLIKLRLTTKELTPQSTKLHFLNGKPYLLFADDIFLITNTQMPIKTNSLFIVGKASDKDFWNDQLKVDQDQGLCEDWWEWQYWQIDDINHICQLFNLKIEAKSNEKLKFSSSYISNCLYRNCQLNGYELYMGADLPSILTSSEQDIVFKIKNLRDDKVEFIKGSKHKNLQNDKNGKYLYHWTCNSAYQLNKGDLYFIQASIWNIESRDDQLEAKAECCWLCGAEIDLNHDDILFNNEKCVLNFKNIDTRNVQFDDGSLKIINNKLDYSGKPQDCNPIIYLKTKSGELNFRAILPYISYAVNGLNTNCESVLTKKMILDKLKKDNHILYISLWCFKANLVGNEDLQIVDDKEESYNTFTFKERVYQDSYNLGNCEEGLRKSNGFYLLNTKTNAKYLLIGSDAKEYWSYERIHKELGKIYMQADKYFIQNKGE